MSLTNESFLKKEIREMKCMLRSFQEKLEKLEKEVYDDAIENRRDRNITFFKKGHDLEQVVVVGGSVNPLSGRYLTLKTLYEFNKPVFIEEICDKTRRSKALETSYLSRLAESKLIRKIPTKVNNKMRMQYEITEKGRKFAEWLDVL